MFKTIKDLIEAKPQLDDKKTIRAHDTLSLKIKDMNSQTEELEKVSNSINEISTMISSELANVNWRKRFIRVTNILSDAVVGTTESGVIVSFNTAAEKLFGYSADEVLGELITTFCKEKKWFNVYLKNGEKIEKNIQNKDKHFIPVEISISKYENGSVFYYFVIRDISNKVELEKLNNKLKQQIAFYRQIFNNVGMPIIVCENNKIIEANDAFCKISNFNIVDLLGKKFSDFITPQKDKIQHEVNDISDISVVGEKRKLLKSTGEWIPVISLTTRDGSLTQTIIKPS